MSSDVDRIKDRIDIAEVIGSYVELEEAGSNLRAKCPFHNEKTPSFFVSPDRGLYYCFGCGAKGDVFTFVQEFEGLDFYGALKLLARKAGVKLTGGSEEARNRRKRLYEVLEIATEYFVGKLQDTQQAQEYLSNRDISEKTMRNFRLGYAPSGWHNIESALTEKGVKRQELKDVGLIKENKSGNYYDRFRERILFPIADTAGRVVGFSGRLIEEKEKAPKYLNSPETDLFEKSSILYGYDKAKRAIRSNNFCILVEGQIDLVLAHQAGFANTAAVLGSSITAHHLQLIQRLTDNLLLAFDADTAGRDSERTAGRVALSLGMDVKVVSLPDGDDPADVIAEDTDEWRSLVRSSTHVISRHLAIALAETDERRATWRRIRADVLPLVAAIPDSIDRSHFVSEINEKAEIPEHAIEEELEKIRNSQELTAQEMQPVKENKQEVTQEEAQTRKQRIIYKIGGILQWQQETDSPVIAVDEVREKVADILGTDILESDWLPEELSLKAEVAYNDTDSLKEELDELLLHLELEYVRAQYLEAMQELREQEKLGQQEKQNDLLKRCQNLSLQLQELKDSLHQPG